MHFPRLIASRCLLAASLITPDVFAASYYAAAFFTPFRRYAGFADGHRQAYASY